MLGSFFLTLLFSYTRVAESEPEIKNVIENDGSEVRAPLPVKRDILYDTSIHHRCPTFLVLTFGLCYIVLIIFCRYSVA